MGRTVLYLAAAFLCLLSGPVGADSAAAPEPLLAGPQVAAIAPVDSSGSSTACLRLGACVNRTIHAATPVIREDYSDGLQWDHDWVSLKFSGNRVKFRLDF